MSSYLAKTACTSAYNCDREEGGGEIRGMINKRIKFEDLDKSVVVSWEGEMKRILNV